jgi:hypothetical protein
MLVIAVMSGAVCAIASAVYVLFKNLGSKGTATTVLGVAETVAVGVVSTVFSLLFWYFSSNPISFGGLGRPLRVGWAAAR